MIIIRVEPLPLGSRPRCLLWSSATVGLRPIRIAVRLGFRLGHRLVHMVAVMVRGMVRGAC